MSSWANPSGRVFRVTRELDEVFIGSDSAREASPVPGAFATASEVIAAAEDRAAALLAAAEQEAARLVAAGQAQQASTRGQAYNEGYEAGRVQALSEFTGALDIARQAAAEGKAIRDSIAGQSAAVVARAVALATRRIVGEYYQAEPSRTALVCAEALRAAAGQEVLAIRVHSGVAAAVRASLADAAQYVRPDGAVDIGGCVIDLRHGTIDATLDARLSLMELALAEAGGEVGR